MKTIFWVSLVLFLLIIVVVFGVSWYRGRNSQDYVLRIVEPRQEEVNLTADPTLSVFGESSLFLGIIEVQVIDSEGTVVSSAKVGSVSDENADTEFTTAWRASLAFNPDAVEGDYKLQIYPQSEGIESDKKLEETIVVVKE